MHICLGLRHMCSSRAGVDIAGRGGLFAMVPTSLIMIRLPRDYPYTPATCKATGRAGDAGPGASGRESGRFLRNTGAGLRQIS